MDRRSDCGPSVNTEGRYALIVATGEYEDAGLHGLWAPVRDATELALVLGDPAIGGFEVQVLDNPGSYALRRRIEDFFADRSLRDTLLLHFACHGLKDESGKLFLAAKDTMRTRLESTAIPAEYVSRLMMKSRAQRAAVLLDCCYAGAFERDMFSRAAADVHVAESFTALESIGRERGRAVLTASSAVEYAFEGNQVVASETAGSTMAVRLRRGEPGPSLFTGALVEGLTTGEADRDHDGMIGLSELADYISHRIRTVTPNQNPQLWIFGARGDLPIARSPRRRPRAAALPGHLAEATASPERAQRLWAVDDLAELLKSADVSLALAAHQALMALCRDDSRRVADAAQRALASAAPAIAARTAWDLGRTTAGQAGPETVLRVEGPPLVRATLEAEAEPWVVVRHVEDGVALSVYTSEPGLHEGRVILRTATGELQVRVRADAVAPAEEPEGGGGGEQDERVIAPPQMPRLSADEPAEGAGDPAPSPLQLHAQALLDAGLTDRMVLEAVRRGGRD
ncbi:caspase family protein [Streptomyces sp. NPDC001970]